MATGLATRDGGVDAFAEAASRAQLGLGGARADLVAVFAGGANLDSVEDGLAAVEARLGPRALMGCGAQGVLGSAASSSRAAWWCGRRRFGEGEAQSFHLEPVASGDDGLVIAGLPELDDADAVIMLADPYSFPVEPLLAQLGVDFPGLPVIGGLASARGPDGCVLLHDDCIAESGAVGAVLRGVDVRACVSQGARPIGPEMVITAAEGNVVHELASRPALIRLREAIGRARRGGAAARGERAAARHRDRREPPRVRARRLPRARPGGRGRGDRLGDGRRPGARGPDGAPARARRRARPTRTCATCSRVSCASCPRRPPVRSCSPATVAASGCSARPTTTRPRSRMRSAQVPAAGFFCAGEIGPVGKRNFLHGFTATMAVFPG